MLCMNFMMVFCEIRNFDRDENVYYGRLHYNTM
jgi:hypothetical protein